MTYEAVTAAAAAIARRTGRPAHRLAVVLGSGLSGYAASLPGAVEVPYRDIPGFPVPKVEGHSGSLISADFGGAGAMVLAGRVHAYEGWDLADGVFAVRTAVASGCATVVLTNAAGGVGDGMAPGDLVLIRDHLNLTARNPLTGPNDLTTVEPLDAAPSAESFAQVHLDGDGSRVRLYRAPSSRNKSRISLGDK